MGAFSTFALAFAPRFLQHFLHHTDSPAADASVSRVIAAHPAHAPRNRDLTCHWTRAADGALVAHWGHDADEAKHGPLREADMLRDIPGDLIDAALQYRRRGSVPALIAMSRMARLKQPKYAPRAGQPANAP